MVVRKRLVRLASFAVLSLFTLAACGGDAGDGDAAARDTGASSPVPAPSARGDVELPEGVTQEMVAQGKTVFETTTCWTCHGMDASGGALAPNLRDQEWLNADGSLEGIARIVREGVQEPKEHPGAMPPMGGARLTDQQVEHVAAYVYALSRGG